MPIYRQHHLEGLDLEVDTSRFYAITTTEKGYVNLRVTLTRARSTDVLGQEHYEGLTAAEALDVINAQEQLLQ